MQMCVGGRWRALCSSSWGYQEAFVVCRQLGLPATGEYVCDIVIQNFLLFPQLLWVSSHYNQHNTHVGFLYAATIDTKFGPRSIMSFYSTFRCHGNESSLINCLYSSSSCTSLYRYDAAVICGGDFTGTLIYSIFAHLSND